MKKGSDIADSPWNGNQFASKSYIHSIRESKKQSIQDAKKASQEYVNDNIADFAKTNNYESLGQAAHTKMDATCPSHVDDNGNPLIFSEQKLKDHNAGNDSKDESRRNKGVSNVKNVIREGLKQRDEYIKSQNNPNKEQGKSTDK